METLYIFWGGNPSHPCRGLPCTIGWELETSPDCVMVYFEHDPRKQSEKVMALAKKLGLSWANNTSIGMEICHKSDLKLA